MSHSLLVATPWLMLLPLMASFMKLERRFTFPLAGLGMSSVTATFELEMVVTFLQ